LFGAVWWWCWATITLQFSSPVEENLFSLGMSKLTKISEITLQNSAKDPFAGEFSG